MGGPGYWPDQHQYRQSGRAPWPQGHRPGDPQGFAQGSYGWRRQDGRCLPPGTRCCGATARQPSGDCRAGPSRSHLRTRRTGPPGDARFRGPGKTGGATRRPAHGSTCNSGHADGEWFAKTCGTCRTCQAGRHRRTGETGQPGRGARRTSDTVIHCRSEAGATCSAGNASAARQAGLTYGQCSASQTGDAREAGQHVFRRICAGSASGPASGDAGTGPTSRSAVSSP